MFGARENQRALAHVLRQDLPQAHTFFALFQILHALRDLIRSLARRRDFHPFGLGQIALAQLFHLLGHGGRKQHGLARRAQMRRNFAQRMDKAHVQHLIRFIEHQIGDSGQVDLLAVQQINQPPRRRHQNIGATRQHRNLAVDRLTTHHGHHLDRGALHQRAQVVGNLIDQFPCGGQHQCLHRPGQRLARLFQQAVHHRQTKGQRFPGACLRKAQNVMSFKRQRYGLGLNRGWGVKAVFLQPFQKSGRQAQFFKLRHDISFPPHPVLAHGK